MFLLSMVAVTHFVLSLWIPCVSQLRKRGVTSYLQEESKMAEGSQCYCICRKPYDSTQFMIGCDSCGEWFHGR